jgi:hypothetical protein
VTDTLDAVRPWTWQEKQVWLEMYAWEKLEEFGLLEKGWTFVWCRRSYTSAGWCDHNKNEVAAAVKVLDACTVEEMEDTILHEIAHALAGPRAGHGPLWKAHAIATGANPKAKFSLPPERQRKLVTKLADLPA